MPKKLKKSQVFLVGIVTNQPDGWEIIAKKESKSMTFVVPLQGTKIDKTDIKFINNNLKHFLELEPEIKDAENIQAV